MNPYLQGWLAVLGFCLGLAGFLYGIFRNRTKDDAEKWKEVNEKITALETGFQVIKSQMGTVWGAVEKAFIASLNHPEDRYGERTDLIRKFVREQITGDEAARLRILLEETAKDMDEPIKDRATAGAVLTIMDARLALRRVSTTPTP